MVTLVLALLCAAPADAPALAPVAVGADAPGEAAANQLQSLAAAAIARSRFTPADLVDALDPERAAARAKSRAGAEASLADAEKAYNDLDTQLAAKQADAAAKGFLQADLSQAWSAYVRARVLKAACLAANGQAKPARTELERLLAVAPDTELPAAQFAPDMLSFARRVRAASRAESKLEVKSSPDGAEVWVDGKRRGVAPLTVRGLSSGEHQLTLRLPGYAVFQQAASGSASATLEPASRQSTWTALERTASNRAALAKAAGALASSAGAAQVLLVVASRGDRADSLSLEVVRADAVGGRTRATAKSSAPVEGLGAAASILLDRALGPDQAPQLVPADHPGPETAAGAPAASKPAGEPFLWTQTHTGVTLMAGGAVLAGTGGFFGYQALVKRDQLRFTPQTDPASQQLIARGQLYALLADVLITSALAAGAAGGYFAFLAPGRGPEAR